MLTKIPVTRFVSTTFICCTALLGCTYHTVATSTAVSSNTIEVDRIRNAHAGFYIELREDLRSVDSKRVGRTCSSHKYPVSIDSALTETIARVMEASFTSHQQYDSPLANSVPENGYTFDIEVDTFEAQLGHVSGTWTGSAHAEAEVRLNVIVVSPQGVELTRTSIQGDGSSTLSGGCASGATALSEAASEAIEEAAQIFVYKVINSPQLDRDRQDAESLAADAGTNE